ncbi:MAG TPA: hypothetical protein GXX18_03340 [Bacillales bacterium]|nr:hypothetical protein [Bacillales bacterium]
MLVNEIPKEKVKYCIENLQTMFDPKVERDYRMMKQALSLFRNGAVYNAAVEGKTITAVVQDKWDTNNVSLELDFMEISFCSCYEKEDLFCVHKLATLFYVFSLFDSPGEFFNQWKEGFKYTATEKMTVSTEKLILEEPKKNERPYQEDSLESWLTFFNEKYIQFSKKREARMSTYWNYQRNTNLAEDLYETYYPTLLDTVMPSSSVGENLFHFHAALSIFEKMLENAADIYSSSYSNHYTRKYLGEILSDIAELAFNVRKSNIDRTDADKKILNETPERLLKILLMTRDFQYDRLYLFQIACSNLMFEKERLNGLKRKLLARGKKEERLKELGKVNFSSECRLALAHLDFMIEKDKVAVKRLSDGPANEVYYYTTWFKSLAQNKIWDRFETWLPFIEKRMNEYIHQYGEQQLKRELATFYLFYIKQYANEKSKKAIYINTLQTWLPYSYSDFCDYLLEQKEFRMWTELQLFAGIAIENIDKGLLKEIEDKERSCLLPLYHHAVEAAISEKNRDAYKQAVKYLRKLRTHYKSLKKEDVWNSYIRMLSVKYKRLRAFQEELRKGKGKLIND